MKEEKERAELKVYPVGAVESERKRASLGLERGELAFLADEERASSRDLVSRVVIGDEFSECVEGLEGFSHVVVIYWSHLVGGEGRKLRKVHPAGQEDIPLVGIFATRSPARPNPICITTVELLGREGNVLTVKGLDAVDGSPVVDIKPHHPHFDSPEDVRLAGWMEDLMERFVQGERE